MNGQTVGELTVCYIDAIATRYHIADLHSVYQSFKITVDEFEFSVQAERERERKMLRVDFQ